MFKEGDMLGPYKLIRRIGKGAFGIVWLGEKKSAIATTNVAIKIPAEDSVDLAAVQREAAVWVSASGHPNVLPIIDADVYGDHVVIVSEYAPDGSLADWLERHGDRAPSTDDAVDMMTGILAGLQHLHRRGIVHRDLKPENILLQGDTPRLADFGIARVLKGTSHTAAASGTPLYMPPEAFDGKRGEPTDIWSAGVIFYQLLTGHLPFNGDGITAMMGAICTKDPEPIVNCPPYIWSVIKMALAKDPADRFASAAEMRKALRRGAVSGSESSTRSFNPGDISLHPTIRVAGGTTDPDAHRTPKEVPDTQKEAPALSRPMVRWAAAALAAILVIGGGIYLYKRQAAPRQSNDAETAALFTRKADAWTRTIFSVQAPSGGIHEITEGEETAQVWSTAQCMAAVLAAHRDIDQYADRIKKGFAFIESFRRSDKSPGWNYYGNASPFTLTEIAGWVVVAETLAVDDSHLLNDAERQQTVARIARDLEEIVQRQDKQGGFRPIQEDKPGYIRTYSSAIALWSLIEARRSPAVFSSIGTRYDENIRRGINWLLLAHKTGQGWVPNPNRPGQAGRFDGLNAQILYILSRAETTDAFVFLTVEPAYAAAKKEFIANSELASRALGKNNSSVPDVDIRFAGSEFMAEGSTFLWFPWTLAEVSQLSRDHSLNEADRASAVELRSEILEHNKKELDTYVEEASLMYIFAENLFCASVYLDSVGQQ